MDDTSSPLPDSEHFWVELDQILQAECTSVQEVDEVLKNYLRFIASSQETHLTSEYDWYRCCYGLLESQIYKKHKSYVRRRIIGRLRKETAPSRIYLAATILLYDGRRNQKTFEVMQNEGMFPRLTQLILEKSEDGGGGLQHRLMELLYEMSRIQKLGYEDLRAVNDMFVSRLFEIIEESADENDPYHYVTIRVLLVLNEQYMVSAHAPPPPLPPADNASNAEETPDATTQEALTNKVIKTLCFKGDVYKTFGENIILLLNRETETCHQLLILKLLYLLFTTSATYEYFYRNDLHVLVDVIIRNLLDLPDDAESLRHTYLRVLYPLLAHSQLRNPPGYKAQELRALFRSLTGIRSNHFRPVDETTERLVARCHGVEWLIEDEQESPASSEETSEAEGEPSSSLEAEDHQSRPSTLHHPSSRNRCTTQQKIQPPKPPRPRYHPTNNPLGMSLPEPLQSSSLEITALTEKPGVQAPSRSRASSTVDPHFDLSSMPYSLPLHESCLPMPNPHPPPPPPPQPRKGSGASSACVVGNGSITSHAARPPPPPAPTPRNQTQLRKCSISSISTTTSSSSSTWTWGSSSNSRSGSVSSPPPPPSGGLPTPPPPPPPPRARRKANGYAGLQGAGGDGGGREGGVEAVPVVEAKKVPPKPPAPRSVSRATGQGVGFVVGEA